MTLVVIPELMAIQPDAALWDAETGMVFERLAAAYEKQQGESPGSIAASAHSDSRE